MERPKPRGILVKRSVSEGPPNKDHDCDPLQQRQYSLSLHRVSGHKKNSSDRCKESFGDVSPRSSIQNAPVTALQTQSAISPHRKLRITNAEWGDEEEEELAGDSASSFERAIPRRTVSFAPAHQIRQLSISKSGGSPTTSVRHQNVSFRADLPRVLQAGIRPDPPERQGIRQGGPAPIPRQLALWEDEELGADGYGQGGHFERPLGTTEGAQIHVKVLDEKMKKIASKSTWSNPVTLGHTTPGYVAAMRRQQYASAYKSFRHPERGLPKNTGKSRQGLLFVCLRT